MAVTCSFGQLFAEWRHNFVKGILLKGFPDPNPADTGFFPDFFLNTITYIILFNNLIPLSLIVTMDFVKLALGTFINNDLDMYYEVNNTPATARTSTLVEELGQIDYIFSDKTGTLTCNIMEFKMASIGGVAYADVVPDDKRLQMDENGKEVGYHELSRLQQHKDQGRNTKIIHEFMTLLAVCHTVIPEHDENDPNKLTYQASSPDEAALVDGAKKLGYLFHTRKPRSVTIAVQGIDNEYQILTVNEFNSTRKRMSVLVRAPDGQVKIMVKGADTVIFSRIVPGCPYLADTNLHLEEYANEGLRTLCIAYRDISEQEYQEWTKIYEKASLQITGRQEALDAAAELIERDLTFLGATAIEDKLQDGVPDAIHTLMEAGIKVWVLTGDRQETAINIGFSCKLLTPDMNLMVCNHDTHFETKEFLEKKLEIVKQSLGAFDSRPKTAMEKFWMGIPRNAGKFDKDIGGDIDPLALVIDGKTLNFALESDIRDTFLQLAMLCKAVCCCRVSPLQKALVVKLVKNNVAGSVTLAIGDGANDVSMIQAAHVGVGISGQEGLQAARSADFAIAQFRFLRKLLLVHGGWAYSRVSKTLFETWSSVSSYNVLWTLTPPVAIGMFDQYVSARILDKYPQMYKLGQTSTFYNHKVFLGWIGNSVFHSLCVFYLWAFIYKDGDILADGRTSDNWVFGIMVYCTTLLTVLIKHCLITDSFVWLTTVSIFGSAALYAFAFPLYAFLGPLLGFSKELYNTNSVIFFSPVFCYKRTFMPQPYHIVQEIQKYNIADYRPRMEWFRKAVHKVRAIQRTKQARGFAFSQNESGQEKLIRSYDTTLRKPRG
ncbi:hypothetical protein HDV02_002716 [Globomyces sp. JEL0801]|nr:hypothetical protein HDV02_002716 [Globomyces sp. JEL0801]